MSKRRVPPIIFRRVFCFVTLFCAALAIVCPITLGQSAIVEARVANVKGAPTVSGSGVTAHTLSRGESLVPGQEINTQLGDQLTIELSDGSIVLVRPGSRVLLKDFRSASTVRDLLVVLLGRVRVKINHVGDRPNPYRINSPTASIAVRGTEFSVSVNASGVTKVSVFEGLVEVASLAEPGKTVLVRRGQSVIVRPGGEIRFFLQGPGGEVGGLGGAAELDEEKEGHSRPSPPSEGAEENSPRNSAGVYNRSVENLIAASQSPLLLRFTAYPDSILDSLENPAFATEFAGPEARVYLLPAFSGTQAPEVDEAAFLRVSAPSADYSLSPQGSFFTPLSGGRTAIGGAISSLQSGVQSSTANGDTTLSGPLFPLGTIGTTATSRSIDSSFLSGSFSIAHAVGNTAHTSIGFGVDYIWGWGDQRSLITQQDATGLVASESISSRTNLAQTRLKIGLSHNFSTEKKLALFYSYGFIHADFADRSHVLNGVIQTPDLSQSAGHISEIGLRFRGVVTRKLFYGLAASGYAANLNGPLRLSIISDAHSYRWSQGGNLTGGLGYALRPRVLLSFDLSGGFASVSKRRTEDATLHLLESRHSSLPFVSAHEAIQADVWRHLFADASLLTIWHKNTVNLSLYPDRFGRFLTSDGVFAPNGITMDRSASYYSEFGGGWRFNENFLAEYVFATTYGLTPSSHIILLRYTFHGREH